MQPVASSPARRVDDLVRLIASGAIDPDTVTAADESILLAAFKAKEIKLLQKIEAALDRGGTRSAWRASEHLRRSMAGRYLALWRSKPPYLADCCAAPPEERDLVRSERLRQILSLLTEVGRLTVPASAVVYTKRKDRNRAYRYLDAPKPSLLGGGRLDRRIIFKFDWIDKARQCLIARSLNPFASYHPSQFLLRWHSGKRGRSAVCEYLRRELPTLTADHVFVQVDVRDFFGSISTTWMEGRFRLSEAMIRRQIHSGEMRVQMDGRARAYLNGGENHERVRRVLPQGSALSSLIAEIAMAEVLDGLADRLTSTRVVTYSDNLGIFMPGAQAAAIMDDLRRAFASSGVGPFDLTMSEPVPLTCGFTFLGHHWRLRGGELHTLIPDQVADARAMVLREQMMSCLAHKGLAKVRQRIRAQAHEWKFWPGVRAWEDDLLSSLDVAWRTVGAIEGNLAQAA